MVPKLADSHASAEYSRSDIAIYDNYLCRRDQEQVFGFLRGPGWAFGAYSDPSPTASRYWYKHFAGFQQDGGEARSAADIEAELATSAPLLANFWRHLKSSLVKGHQLARCYANGYPAGAEGGLHSDSNIPDHYTALYYPFSFWSPNFAGETVFFNQSGDDIIASVYPRPNRLVIFPGVIPHVARGVARGCPELRITLMFKTGGRAVGSA